MKHKFKLGEKARDTITGFEGTVTARYEYLNGCIRYELHAKNEKASDEPKGFVFDVDQLEKVKAPKAKLGKPSGGPMPNPPRTGH